MCGQDSQLASLPIPLPLACTGHSGEGQNKFFRDMKPVWPTAALFFMNAQYDRNYTSVACNDQFTVHCMGDQRVFCAIMI